MHSYRNILLALFIGLSISSCKRNSVETLPLSSFTVKADSMSVANDSANYKLGSLSTFNFTGNPLTITFYSGEIGKRYIYRDRTTADGTPMLIFKHTLNTGTQNNTLHVMLSSDFKGYVPGDSAATANNISAASWSDITPAKISNKTATALDTINLSSFAAAGKKVVIAFKYTAAPGSIQNKWTIESLALNNYLADKTQYTIANLNAVATPIMNYDVADFGPGWVAQHILNNTYKWVITAGSKLEMAGATSVAAATSDIETWVLTGQIDLKKVTPDRGIGIKDMTVNSSSYSYKFPAKGKYDVYFEANNNTIYSSESGVRKIPVVIK